MNIPADQRAGDINLNLASGRAVGLRGVLGRTRARAHALGLDLDLGYVTGRVHDLILDLDADLNSSRVPDLDLDRVRGLAEEITSSFGFLRARARKLARDGRLAGDIRAREVVEGIDLAYKIASACAHALDRAATA